MTKKYRKFLTCAEWNRFEERKCQNILFWATFCRRDNNTHEIAFNLLVYVISKFRTTFWIWIFVIYIYSDQDISDILNSYLELYSNHKKSQFELTNINLMNSTPRQGIIFFLYMPSWWRDIPFAVRVNICNMPTTLILYKEIFHCSPMKIVSMGKMIKYSIFCIFKVEYFTPFWDIHDKNI